MSNNQNLWFSDETDENLTSTAVIAYVANEMDNCTREKVEVLAKNDPVIQKLLELAETVYSNPPTDRPLSRSRQIMRTYVAILLSSQDEAVRWGATLLARNLCFHDLLKQTEGETNIEE